MRFLRLLAIVAALAAGLQPALAGRIADADLSARVAALGAGGFDEVETAITDLAATGDDRVPAILDRLGEGELMVRKADGAVFFADKAGKDFRLTDPVTGADAGPAPKATVEKIKVNNRIRRAIASAVGALTLMSPDPAVRRAAAEAVMKSADAAALPALEQAIAVETVPDIRTAMVAARATALLASDAPESDKVASIAAIADLGSRDALGFLSGYTSADGAVGDAARKAAAAIESRLMLWDMGQNLWYGLSLGSVLLLAAIGLAITFGVMGVINMAHGEMVMLGAYATFTVQEVIRTSWPGLFDYSLLIALPVAFLTAALAGILIERSVIRWLYGRPLETLLATWGVSLILQQAVRSLYGANNREVGNPSWMSGSFSVGDIQVTWTRLWIILFALAVFLALIAVLKRTRLGLEMRAVTQNRQMAAAVGIRTPLVDALTFGLGSGIAGLAGVALSQIDNVSPNLGRGYIIDSFMVVVFGGVGNLWGTLVGALTLGVANKMLEPYAGAVLGKIILLLAIILFIQKRPRGLFALKGRAVEA
ncbi:Amino acid or sugar ABC transport system, permease protein [uncultured Pleomorphomonas sp.]|uniref:Amino acid or sugar ABC transport system, permease protein n=1 Tax=uncultured Pleomorphomonas sp. TaxID=442121 RepID=A0A212LKC8_9HYPH|nr:urea ABC transporter permease subunit UrtB [uncultured Pleomorphomonas sp.]SCM78001.1 Amino acid or sugar ABC transport system, permease protein [uncultured Pleomorphomonas sp.]